jgi:hypothetical protein
MRYKIIYETDDEDFRLEEPNDYNFQRAKPIPLFLLLLYKMAMTLYYYTQHKIYLIEKEPYK